MKTTSKNRQSNSTSMRIASKTKQRGTTKKVGPITKKMNSATAKKAVDKVLGNNLTFGDAIEALKKGKRVTRIGWNGKSMWVSRTPGKVLDLNKHDIWTPNVKRLAKENGGKVKLLPYLSMKTAQGDLQIGWLASQSDMLATDWMIVK